MFFGSERSSPDSKFVFCKYLWGRQIGLISCCIFSLSACIGKPAPPPYRYRITVEIQTPTGIRSGSSVREITARDTGCCSPRYEINGEAVVVEVSPKLTIFALIGTEKDEKNAASAPAYAYLSKEVSKGVVGAISLRRIYGRYFYDMPNNKSKKYLPRWRYKSNESMEDDGRYKIWPEFVKFKDYKNIKSVVILDPDNLGENIFVSSIYIESTKDPITNIIGTYFPKKELFNVGRDPTINVQDPVNISANDLTRKR